MAALVATKPDPLALAFEDLVATIGKPPVPSSTPTACECSPGEDCCGRSDCYALAREYDLEDE